MKLKKNMSARLKEERKIVEFEMDVLVCEPEHGPLFGEDVNEDAEKERLVESLMDFVKSTNQLMEEMTMRPNETKRSYVFETDDLFVIIGFVADDRKYFETVLKFDEESLSNEERSEILQPKELIDELLDGGTQSIEDDLR